MRKLVFVVLVSSLLLTLTFVQRGNIPSVKASPDIYQGDLVLTGNNVTVIENRRFDINGSIIVEENATLILKNALVNFTQTTSHEHNMFFQNPANGHPRLQAINSTLTSNLSMSIYLSSSLALLENSTVSLIINARGSSNLTILLDSNVREYHAYHDTRTNINNSEMFSLSVYDSSKTQVFESVIDNIFIFTEANCTISELKPSIVETWNFVENCSVEMLPGEAAPNLTLFNTKVNNWLFQFYSSSHSLITDSEIHRVDTTDEAFLHMESTLCGVIFAGSFSMCQLVNATCSSPYLWDSAEIYVSWYLDVQVVDSLGQDVPSANVTAAYPNATPAGHELTDTNGQSKLILREKMLNATDEYPVGNYTVEATYDIYSDATTVNMTENQQITLTLEGFIIPEFPSFLILPLFMIATLLAVIVYRRKHAM